MSWRNRGLRCGWRPRWAVTLVIAAALLVAAVSPVFRALIRLVSRAPVTWNGVYERIARDWPEVPQMTTQELERRIAGEEHDHPIVLDVRTREEYEVSHLPGAVLAENSRRVRESLLGVPADRIVVVYCSVGIRSSIAARKLIRSGRVHVFNLKGSIFKWANEDRPLVRDGRPVREIHCYDSSWAGLLNPGLRGGGKP